MEITALEISGLHLIRPERLTDERGYFVRTFSRDAFEAAGLEDCSLQCSISNNIRRGTLRGMHMQASPHEEAKLVRCARGSIWDAVVDLRPGSSTFGRWYGVELSQANGLSLYIPRGLAHGFITLTDDTDVYYQMSVPFVSGAGIGLRWNDPDIGITWPLEPVVMNARDRDLPLLKDMQQP